MTARRRILAACALAASGALSAPARAAASPTPAEMAPLAIPSNVTKDTDRAARLQAACEKMTLGAADASVAKNFAAASLSGLLQACADVGADQTLSAADVASLRAFWANPSQFENQIITALAAAARNVMGTRATAERASSLPSISSGSLESDIIQGLAQFVYDRAKQEATLYLGKELTQKLCTGDPALFFPAICVALPSDPTIPLGAMGSYLAAAARADLGQLPDRALAYELHGLGPSQERSPSGEALFGARLALAYYQAVRTGRTPLDVARSMHELRVPSGVVGANTDVLRMTTVLSELVDSVEAQQGWTSLSQGLPALPYDALGVIFTFEAQYTTDGTPFGPLADDKIAAAIPLVTQYLIDVASLADRASAVKLALTSPSAPGSGDLTVRDYLVVVTQTLAETFQSGQRVLGALGINVSDAVAATIAKLAAATEIGEQIAGGQSAATLAVQVVQLVEQLTTGPTSAASPPLTGVQPWLALVAQIAQASSADEVANVLDAAAVPPSTYQLKYQKNVVAVGALAGVSGGAEWVRTNGSAWSTGGVVGAFAPVGLTASTPLGTWFHAGVMVSVLNIGALVSARFSEDFKTTSTAAGTATTTVQTDPQVKLSNLLAPGAFLTLGIARSPFVLSVGGQVVPVARQLTTVDPSGNTMTSTAPAIQLVGSLSVDVPIFSL